MRFSPLEDSTRITATPVDWDGIVWMDVVSMREDFKEEIREGPNLWWVLAGEKGERGMVGEREGEDGRRETRGMRLWIFVV